MAGRSDGRTVGRSDGRTFGRSDGQTFGRSDGPTVGRSEVRTVGRSGGRAVGRSGGRAAGRSCVWAVGRLGGQAAICYTDEGAAAPSVLLVMSRNSRVSTRFGNQWLQLDSTPFHSFSAFHISDSKQRCMNFLVTKSMDAIDCMRRLYGIHKYHGQPETNEFHSPQWNFAMTPCLLKNFTMP